MNEFLPPSLLSWHIISCLDGQDKKAKSEIRLHYVRLVTSLNNKHANTACENADVHNTRREISPLVDFMLAGEIVSHSPMK